MFNEEEEVKWFRGADQKLQCRERKDQEDQMDPLFFWDEWQYLDINEQKSKPEKGIAYAQEAADTNCRLRIIGMQR